MYAHKLAITVMIALLLNNSTRQKVHVHHSQKSGWLAFHAVGEKLKLWRYLCLQSADECSLQLALSLKSLHSTFGCMNSSCDLGCSGHSIWLYIHANQIMQAPLLVVYILVGMKHLCLKLVSMTNAIHHSLSFLQLKASAQSFALRQESSSSLPYCWLPVSERLCSLTTASSRPLQASSSRSSTCRIACVMLHSIKGRR